MDKKHIIAEIIRTAVANDSKPLGLQKFEGETGIKRSDWYGIHWSKWSEAVKEAGLEPNIMNKAYPDEFLIEKLITFIQELTTFPTAGELRLKSHHDKSFPSHNTFSRLGKKHEIAAKIIKHCERKGGLGDVIEICRPVSVSISPKAGVKIGEGTDAFGHVYLMKSGRYYKIGRSASVGRRQYDLGIKLPEDITTIHQIGTDDPLGIEKYWHQRFKKKKGRVV